MRTLLFGEHSTSFGTVNNRPLRKFGLMRVALTFNLLAALLMPIGADASAAIESRKLHVPSPDWRDQIIYFLMTDRFEDGDKSNNDMGVGEYDPKRNSTYNGGDLKGISKRLDYIKGLGATAIWITPPVANQWWDPTSQFSGFHGYWAEHFMQVDRHLGSLEDYRNLSHDIHSAGMYLIQDIVVNHTGNYFSYAGEWDRQRPYKNFKINEASAPTSRPTQWPFNLNDARISAHRKARIFHWTPNITDYTNKHQELNFQMSDLDDLNTENRTVRRALRESYGYWIKEVGVDAYRVDTAFYVPADFFDDFLRSTDKYSPGVLRIAEQTGRQNFHVFGEGFGIDRAFQNGSARKLENYMVTPKGTPLLLGMLNFPLYGTSGDVFARGRPTAELGYRIRDTLRTHQRPHMMPTFVDNHDVDRYLAGGTISGLKQSLLLIMTLPGIPTIYYGTEQSFTEQRGAMFKEGFQSGGRDRFDTTSEMYQFIKAVSTMRREHKVFSRGRPTVLRENAASAGALAYRLNYGAETAIVAFNSADHESILDNADTSLPEGTLLTGIFSIDGAPRNIVVGRHGRISLTLPPRAGLAWRAAKLASPHPNQPPSSVPLVEITTNPLKSNTLTGNVEVKGHVKGATTLSLVVDGNVSGKTAVAPTADGRWKAVINTSQMLDPNVTHEFVLVAQNDKTSDVVVSERTKFRVQPRWRTLVSINDPAGDDRGPRGTYVYPTDPTWGANRQLDIRRTTVSSSGGALRIELKMNKITRTWNPQNGFDHVAFTIFFELPGRAGGLNIMPLQNTPLPEGMRWHYRLRCHGWSNTLFSHDGASAESEGTIVTPAAHLAVDPKRNKVTFTIASSALGGLREVSGAKLYVTTWDYDAGYRKLNTTPATIAFGGGEPSAPLVMDDTVVIVLP
ncbi:MAG: alpha-amylase [Rhodocyclaceae bacterium]|nr:alpha-amylase [Rhodocyclaceae bacterium]